MNRWLLVLSAVGFAAVGLYLLWPMLRMALGVFLLLLAAIAYWRMTSR